MRGGVTEKNSVYIWFGKMTDIVPGQGGIAEGIPVTKVESTWAIISRPVTTGERKAQRGIAVTPRSHSKWMAELGFERRLDGNCPEPRPFSSSP